MNNPFTGNVGRNPAIIASNFGFRVYRTFTSELAVSGSTKFIPNYDFNQPVINYYGFKIRD